MRFMWLIGLLLITGCAQPEGQYHFIKPNSEWDDGIWRVNSRTGTVDYCQFEQKKWIVDCAQSRLPSSHKTVEQEVNEFTKN